MFDRGYVTVTPELKFIVSRRLREDYENGKTYHALHGRDLAVPSAFDERPAASAWEWHNQNQYLG